MPPKSNLDLDVRNKIKARQFYKTHKWTLQAQHKAWRDKINFEKRWGVDAVPPVLHTEERHTILSWD